MSTSIDLKSLELQAAAAIESGDPADAKRFAQASGMAPGDFQAQLQAQGAEQLALTVRAHLDQQGNVVNSGMTTDEFYSTLSAVDRPVFDQSLGGFVIHAHPEIGVYPRSYEHCVHAFARSKGVALVDDEHVPPKDQGIVSNYTAQELDTLALIATGRSGGALKEAPFKEAGLLNDAKDGWTDLTAKGEAVLRSAGYDLDPKRGWQRAAYELQGNVPGATEQLSVQLVGSDHGYDDYDIQGCEIHRVTIPHGIKRNEMFNVYGPGSSKRGGTWQGSVEKSIERFLREHAATAGVAIDGKVESAKASLSDLYAKWDKLRNVTVTEGGVIEQDHFHFKAGTHREEIWRWFESQNPQFIVGEVMQGIRRQEEGIVEAAAARPPAPAEKFRVLGAHPNRNFFDIEVEAIDGQHAFGVAALLLKEADEEGEAEFFAAIPAATRYVLPGESVVTLDTVLDPEQADVFGLAEPVTVDDSPSPGM